MSEIQPLKYSCYQKDVRDHILSLVTDQEIKNHIIELYNLIEYQMKMINEQRLKIVAIEYQQIWKQYDKPIEKYDPTTRSYKL